MDKYNRNNCVSPRQKADEKLVKAHRGGTSVAAKLKAGETLGPLDQQIIARLLSRKWRSDVSISEWALLSYINDRTVGWGKPTFRAAVSNILNGTEEYAGVGLSRRGYFRAAKTLEEKCMIVRKRGRDCTTLGLNLEHPDMSIATPNQTQKVQKCHIGTTGSAMRTLQKCLTGTQNSKSSEEKSFNTSSPLAHQDYLPDEEWDQISENEISSDQIEEELNLPPENFEPEFAPENCNGLQSNPQEAVEAKLALVAEKREREAAAKIRKAKRKPKSRLNTTDLEQVWRAGMAEHFPDAHHMAWSTDTKKRVKPFMTRFNTQTTGDLLEFAAWSVKNWRLVLRRNTWMKDAPSVPTINWWMSSGVQSIFAEARVDAEENRISNKTKRTDLENLMRGGLSEEEAILKLAERKARDDLKEEMRNSERRASAERFAAAQAKEDASRMGDLKDKISEVLSGDNETAKNVAAVITEDANGKVVVPHPRSPKMERIRKEALAQERAKELSDLTPPATNTGVGSGFVPTETWEEMQERIRQERQAQIKPQD